MLLTVSGQTDGYLQFLTVLLLFVFVLAITYFTTKWIANYQKGRVNAGNIEVIETYKITANKYIQIVKTGTKYLVIAIGKDEITMLTELDPGEVSFARENVQQTMDFGSVLEKVKKLGKMQSDEMPDKKAHEDETKG